VTDLFVFQTAFGRLISGVPQSILIMYIRENGCISHCKTIRVNGVLGVHFDTAYRGNVLSKHFMPISTLYELIKSHKELEKIDHIKKGVEVVNNERV